MENRAIIAKFIKTGKPRNVFADAVFLWLLIPLHEQNEGRRQFTLIFMPCHNRVFLGDGFVMLIPRVPGGCFNWNLTLLLIFTHLRYTRDSIKIYMSSRMIQIFFFSIKLILTREWKNYIIKEIKIYKLRKKTY